MTKRKYAFLPVTGFAKKHALHGCPRTALIRNVDGGSFLYVYEDNELVCVINSIDLLRVFVRRCAMLTAKKVFLPKRILRFVESGKGGTKNFRKELNLYSYNNDRLISCIDKLITIKLLKARASKIVELIVDVMDEAGICNEIKAEQTEILTELINEKMREIDAGSPSRESADTAGV